VREYYLTENSVPDTFNVYQIIQFRYKRIDHVSPATTPSNCRSSSDRDSSSGSRLLCSYTGIYVKNEVTYSIFILLYYTGKCVTNEVTQNIIIPLFLLTFNYYNIKVVFSTIRTKGLVKNMMDKERITAPSPKTDYWKDKNWNDTNGLLWFVQVRSSMILSQ
jgi:hypothetical protein